MDIRPSTVAEMQRLGATLFDANQREVDGPGAWPVEPDWDRYFAIEQCGQAMLLAGWHVDVGVDTLVAYSVNFIVAHPHHRGKLMCHNDVLYVAPDQRGENGAALLMDATNAAALERGCMRILWHAPTGSRLERILERRVNHYRRIETTYARDV